MPITIRKHIVRWAVAAITAVALVGRPAFAGGPVMLVGHDPDDHGFETEYAGLYDYLLANIDNGGSGILAIGANPGSAAGVWIQDVAALMSPPQTVTFVNGTAISTQSFSGFAILHVPSTDIDTPGGIDDATEMPLLNARAVDVANFVNGGGALFGLTQDALADPYAYVSLFMTVTSIGVPASGDCDGAGGSALFDDVTATPLGQTLGISDTNVDGCCWHNAFSSYPGFLQPLVTVNEPSCTIPIDGLVAMVGCQDCSVPGQLNLEPALAFNPPGTDHTVTATFVEGIAPNDPIVGVTTDFDVVSGPNAGASGSDATDIDGQAFYTYTGSGGPGVDRIEATAVDPGTSNVETSNTVLKFWDEDCNDNGIPDTCDLDCDGFAGDCLNFAACGQSADANGNDIPDDCDDCVTDAGCDDGNVCTDDDCVLPGAQCTNTFNTAPCDDGLFCTATDVCAGGGCVGSDDPCLGPPCDELNDECGDCVTDADCNDGSLCTTEQCNAGNCSATPIDCSFLNTECTVGQCDAQTGECVNTNVNDGDPCDDGNPCSTSDVCLAGVCSACGNGSVEAPCNETCDPPDPGVCDPTCNTVVCGNGIVQSGEECDDANTTNGDGCDDQCLFEDKLCIEGKQPSVARQAKYVAFASDFDYTGQNVDGNQEIYIFKRKLLDKDIKRGIKRGVYPDIATAKLALFATAMSRQKYFVQVTDTTSPVVNELPSLSRTGRVAAYVSNVDGNRDIYRKDIKQAVTVQVTTTDAPVENLNPNLRAYNNLLSFDSNGNLAAGLCVGDLEHNLLACTGNSDCGAGTCGNPEGNREVFLYVHSAYSGGGVAIRELTAAPSGDSTVGQSVNFNTRATAFASTANLLGANPEQNSEIYRIAKTPDTLVAITQTTSGEQADPAQASIARTAFSSSADLAGANGDGNREIVVYDESLFPAVHQQVGTTLGCFNAVPATDARGRYVGFHSSCNRIPTLGNPDQSVFMWDHFKLKFLPMAVRGELNAASANAQVTSRLGVLTYESNLGSIVDPAVCFLNVRRFLKSLEQLP